jgi:hypothetical protein
MPTNDKIKLSETARRLREDYGVSVSYRSIYHKVLDGIIPAERDASGGRWVVNVSDLPTIAESMKSSL